MRRLHRRMAHTPYWVVMDFSEVRGINGAFNSIGWGATADQTPAFLPPLPPDHDPTLGTNGAAFTHFYGNANPFWQDITDTASEEIFYVSMAVEAIPISGGLQPGDADQDLDFDQMDLIRVQQAAKFLTGQAATWGEGDWDGAPGGEPGNPPTGDGLFDQIDVIAALGAGKYLTGSYAAVQARGTIGDGQTSVIYNAGTGELAVDTPAATELTSINIDSVAGIFTGAAAANLGGSFDNDADANIFKATFGGSFGSVSFGNVAQAGLSEEFVLGDLSVVGSLAGGGDLGDVDLVYVPEPTSVLLLSVGLAIGFVCFRRVNR